METRKIGETELQIYPIVFGGNVFGWTIDEKQSNIILDEFVGGGFNCIDTADSYSRWAPGNSGGESETIIGKWMHQKKNRSEIILATKVGSDMGDGKKGVSKKYILQAAEDSLKRLKTDYIDLYQTHFDDEATPVEETMEAYAELVKSGKVRYIGTSNMSADRLKESLAVSAENGYPLYQCVQPHYNLYAREKFESTLEPICLGHSLGVITYFSLESGFLTGKYRTKADLNKSPRGGDMDKYFNERGLRILEALDQVAAEYNSEPASVALAWLINRPSVTAPIVSATKKEQLNAIMKAPELNLNADAIRFLNSNSNW